MRKALMWSLGVGLLMIAVATYPVVAQSQSPGSPHPTPGHSGKPGAMTPSSSEKPLISATDLKPLEGQGMIPMSQAIRDAESHTQGKAVAVIPVKSSTGEVSFQVYTLKDGQLHRSTVDAKNGRVLSSQQTNDIAELTRTSYAGHEEIGGEQPGGMHQPQPNRP